MAKISYTTGDFEDKLERLGSRESIRRIVEAGSAAAVEKLKESTSEHRHVVTGELRESISAGPLHEDLGSAWQFVYPGGLREDNDKNLAMIASVINYGYGGRKTAKTGDKFITGHKKTLDEAVGAAMRAEAERIKNEIMR